MRSCIIFLGLFLLAGFCDASCLIDCDFAVNLTLDGLEGNVTLGDSLDVGSGCYGLGDYSKNIEDECNIWGNLTNVRIRVTNGSALYNYQVVDSDDARIFLQVMDACGGSCPSYGGYLELCLNGTGQTYSHSRIASASAGGDYTHALNYGNYSHYYRRNWTFKDESDGSDYSFLGNNASLIVSCENYGGHEYNLTALANVSMTIQTRELPVFNLNVDGIQRSRADKDWFLKDDFFILDSGGLDYKFSLGDYTGQCNDLLRVQRSISDVMDTVSVTRFGLERDAYVYLEPDSPYRFIIHCVNNGLYDYGIITLSPNDTELDIDVTSINISSYQNRYDGGFVFDFTTDFDSGVLALEYDKEEGLIDVINLTVYIMNETPYPRLHSAQATDVKTGSLQYSVPNTSYVYYAVAYAVNEGHEINRSSPEYFRNQSSRLIDFGLPSEVMGVYADTIYIGFAFLVMLVGMLAFSMIDVGMGITVLGALGGLFNLIGWVDLPDFLLAVTLLLGIAVYNRQSLGVGS